MGGDGAIFWWAYIKINKHWKPGSGTGRRLGHWWFVQVSLPILGSQFYFTWLARSRTICTCTACSCLPFYPDQGLFGVFLIVPVQRRERIPLYCFWNSHYGSFTSSYRLWLAIYGRSFPWAGSHQKSVVCFDDLYRHNYTYILYHVSSTWFSLAGSTPPTCTIAITLSPNPQNRNPPAKRRLAAWSLEE